MLAGAFALTAPLAAILLPAPAASAQQVGCNDPNFVNVTYHYDTRFGSRTDHSCFAGAGWNRFVGHKGYTSWMDHISTGNNDVTFRDCNGTLVDYPRGTDTNMGVSRCISDIGIKPY
jgi:hypothetical protein